MDNINKKSIAELFGNALNKILVLLAISTFKGTILWLTFPYIHNLFPSAISNGILPAELGWWSSVCVTYIFASFLPSITTSTKE